jgi:hypothetical protein
VIDDDLKAACKQVVADVDRLQRYTQEDMSVEAGSPIHDDDHVLTEFSIRELIDAPIRAAIDNLVVVAVTLDTWKTVRGYAHPTLARSAITGAGTALWLMHPDVKERRLRALRMSYQIASNELKFVEGMPVNWTRNKGPSAAVKQSLTSTRQQKTQRVLENGSSLGFTENVLRAHPKDWQMVEDGAKRLPPSTFHCPPEEHILTEWRLLSGRAHGNIWPVHYSDTPPVKSSDPRFVTASVAMSLDRMLGSAHTALTMVNCAVDCFGDLIKAP